MNTLFDIINVPMGYVMRFLNNIAGNEYILALFLFAIFIEIILLPFGIKQQKNSIKQAKLHPKEMAIRKKYAGRDDQATKQKISEEIQALYQREGFSPLAGCGPMLIQLPILIALYNMVLNPLRYICQLSNDTINTLISVMEKITGKDTYTAQRTIDLMADIKNHISVHGTDAFASVEGFSERISGVADLPNLTVFGIDLSGTPSFTNFNWLMLVPVLTFLAYFFSMKMTRKFTYQATMANDPQQGCSNKMMDLMMPLMSVYICFIVPAAVGVYWIFKSLIGVVKQFILHKTMPTPVFTEEDYKAAEKEYGAKPEKNAKKTTSSGKPVRSLHHIDDEDFPDTAPAAAARRARLEEAEAKEKVENEAKKEKKVIDAAPIKDDKKEDKKESEENK